MTTFFSFAVADGMFDGSVTVTRKVATVEEVRGLVESGVVPALNPSHTATIHAMQSRFGLHVTIPAKAPMVKLTTGDKLVVMSVRGLPRREGVAEYTQVEIDSASFEFSIWEVVS